MCGIAGVFLFDRHAGVDPSALEKATSVIAHRGPDDQGLWLGSGIGLGSRRLAVIDLSDRGHQPMSNEDRSIWVVFNGEIYNFQYLRQQLESKGHVFRSNTDTETVVHLYEEDGIEAIGQLRGMFAVALWDSHRDAFFLVRDRLGKKPLFYYQDANRLVFGSEIKCILRAGIRADPDLEAIDHYLTFGYVPAPWSAFQSIRKLLPGHYLRIANGQVSERPYWQPHYGLQRTESEESLLAEFSGLLEESTRLRMIADVPLGALLSGGLDSSAVVATMRRVTSGPIRTFSIGFEQPEYDELAYARQVAQRFETEHHELVVRPDAVAMVPRLVWHYNEPFADSSAVPSFAVCELARRFVTVALNGDGGDETWLGYDRYVAAAALEYQSWIPRGVRRLLARSADHLPLGHAKSRVHRVRRFASGLAQSPLDQYTRWIAIFDETAKRELCASDFRGGTRSMSIFDSAVAGSDARTFVEAVAHGDLQTYLPDDLLVKMDIASMAHSLEVRSPFLDHQLVEFAMSVPLRMKLRRSRQKYLLRQLMRGVLPAPVLRRRKMGFGVPIDRWFRHELREMAYDLLLDSRAASRGYFRPDVVRRYLDEHCRGTGHHHSRLWSLLMLEVWHRTFIDQACPATAPLAAISPRPYVSRAG